MKSLRIPPARPLLLRSQIARHRMAGKGVCVNAIAPGVFRTELNAGLLTARTRQGIQIRTPMGRFGKLEELAGAAVFLASDAASFRHRPRSLCGRRLPRQRRQSIGIRAFRSRLRGHIQGRRFY